MRPVEYFYKTNVDIYSGALSQNLKLCFKCESFLKSFAFTVANTAKLR